MVGVPKPAATLADLAELDPRLRGEIIEGVLYTQPRPASPHAVATSFLGSDLVERFARGRGGPGGWVILDEPEIHLGPAPEVFVPDLAGWRKERFAPSLAAHFTLAPDWACEVLSPSTQGYDRLVKLRAYARHGVAWIWLLDPITRAIEVYARLDAEPLYVLRTGSLAEDTARLPPFEAAELDLASIWALVPTG